MSEAKTEAKVNTSVSTKQPWRLGLDCHTYDLGMNGVQLRTDR